MLPEIRELYHSRHEKNAPGCRWLRDLQSETLFVQREMQIVTRAAFHQAKQQRPDHRPQAGIASLGVLRLGHFEEKAGFVVFPGLGIILGVYTWLGVGKVKQGVPSWSMLAPSRKRV